MIPTVAQQLRTMKRRLEETIFPEIPASAQFAREQAAFIITTINWLIDTQAHEYRYEVVENAEYRKLIADILGAYGGSLDWSADLAGSAQQALRERGPSSDEAAIPLGRLSEQNRRLKALAAEFFNAEQGGPKGDVVRDLFIALALRQNERERAFFKGTGFTQSERELDAILNETSYCTQAPLGGQS